MSHDNKQFVISGSSAAAAICDYIRSGERRLKKQFGIMLRIVWFSIFTYYINT